MIQRYAKKAFALVTLTIMVLMPSAAFANPNSVTQGYDNGGEILRRGTIVSLDIEDTTRVIPATRENDQRLHGVVIAPNDAPLTISEDTEKTFVASIGRYDALVSTEGGVIQAGDFLSVSSLSGVAKKSSEYDVYTVGKAIESFDGTNAISNTALQDSSGGTQDVALGRIVIDVGIGPNPLLRGPDVDLPKFIEGAAEAIAGKEVSLVRIYISIVLLIVSGSIAGSLLYSGIRSSFIAIGRNPLSKKSVVRSMVQVVISSSLIFLLGIFAVYLLLRLYA